MEQLTIGEKIDKAKDGRTQNWIVLAMTRKGININEVKFSRKKKGLSTFTEEEIKVLSEILGTDLTK